MDPRKFESVPKVRALSAPIQLLSEVGWSLDLTPQENYQAIRQYSPELAADLQRPIPNLLEIVFYYPINEEQDLLDRVRYYAPVITPLDLLISISEYYYSPVPPRTLRAAGRRGASLTATRRDLLEDHSVLIRLTPYEDGYALYFS